MPDFLILSGIIVYVWYALFPLLQTGYFADDALNVTAQADAELKGWSVLQLTWTIWYTGWFKTMGRLFPLAFYAYSAFAILKPLIVYKTATLLIILLDILAFGWLVKTVTRSKYFAYALMLTVCVFFQFRIWYEPILSFHFMMPLVLLEILVSLNLYLKFTASGNRLLLVGAVFLYLTALLTYEISYPLCLIYPLLSLSGAGREPAGSRFSVFAGAVKRSRMFFFAAAFLALLSVYFRSAVPFDKGGAYTITFTPVLFLRTLWIQIFGSFPLVYFLSNRSVFNPQELMKWVKPGDLIITVGFGCFFYRLASRVKEEIAIVRISCVGAALIVLPALLVSLSPKHQATPLGSAYLQVYLQYYGAALLTAVLVLLVRRILKRSGKPRLAMAAGVFLACVISAAALVNMLCNRYVAERMNRIGYYPMITIEKALKNGLLADIPEESVILADSASAWDRQQYYYWLLGRKFTVATADPYLAARCKETLVHPVLKVDPSLEMIPAGDLAEEGIYLVKYYGYAHRDNGCVLFGRLSSVFFDRRNGRVRAMNVDALRLFTWGESAFEVLQGESGISSESRSSMEYHVIPKMPQVRSGRDFFLYEMPMEGETLDFSSLVFSTRNYGLENLSPAVSFKNGRWTGSDGRTGKAACLYSPGKWISHTEGRYLTSGWSADEGTHRWSEGRQGSMIDFRLKSRRAGTVMRLVIVPRMVLGSQHAQVYINNTKIGELFFDKQGEYSVEFNSSLLLPFASNSIKLVFPDARTYRNDPRLMAVALGKIGLFY
ncbi:MAG: hypothetical protein WBE75_05945 [Candidatus Omnitrophota bacterium]